MKQKRGRNKLKELSMTFIKKMIKNLWAIYKENYKVVLGYIKQDEQIEIYTMLSYRKINFTKLFTIC